MTSYTQAEKLALLDNMDIPLKPDAEQYERSDIGAGNLFVDTYRNVVRYVAQQKVYYVWNEKCWSEDSREQVKEMAKDLVSKQMPQMAGDIVDDRSRQEWLKWSEKMQSNRLREEMLKSARSKPEIAVDLAEFDKQIRYFNLQNGVFDLDNYVKLRHDEKYLLSKIANVSYKKDAKCERWETFVLEVMGGDAEAAKFLQKAIGYSMLGDPQEDCMFILYGPKTRNGKSTFCRTILNIFGEYACSAQPESLALSKNKNSSGPSPDIARLAGARFVNMAEPAKNMELDAALVKTLTGRDTITARHLHREFFEFAPHFVLFMNTNYLPRIDDMTLFTSDRMFCIPFNVHFDAAQQDRSLEKTFGDPDNMSGILNWCIDGLKLYRAEGLKDNIPQLISNKTQEYADTSDTFGQFIDECIVTVENEWVQSSRIYEAYRDWTQRNGHKTMSMKNVSSELKRRNYEYKIKNSGSGFLNIVIKNEGAKANFYERNR